MGVELSKYDIQYAHMGSIKSQAIDDFIPKINSPIDNDPPYIRRYSLITTLI